MTGSGRPREPEPRAATVGWRPRESTACSASGIARRRLPSGVFQHAAVVVGGIEPLATEFDEAIENGERRPVVDACAEVYGAEAQLAHRQVAGAEGRAVHRFLSKECGRIQLSRAPIRFHLDRLRSTSWSLMPVTLELRRKATLKTRAGDVSFGDDADHRPASPRGRCSGRGPRQSTEPLVYVGARAGAHGAGLLLDLRRGPKARDRRCPSRTRRPGPTRPRSETMSGCHHARAYWSVTCRMTRCG
jgi:hypothetical protein